MEGEIHLTRGSSRTGAEHPPPRFGNAVKVPLLDVLASPT